MLAALTRDGSNGGAAQALEQGAVELVLAAMTANGGDKYVQSAACRALVGISGTPEGVRRVCSEGGVACVLAGMKDHKGDVGVQVSYFPHCAHAAVKHAI